MGEDWNGKSTAGRYGVLSRAVPLGVCQLAGMKVLLAVSH